MSILRKPAKEILEEFMLRKGKMKVITRLKAIGKILNSTGNYKVTFTKLNGDERVMLARQNVEHNTKSGKSYEGDNKDLLTTFDVDLFEYRRINLATISRLKINNKTYKVV